MFQSTRVNKYKWDDELTGVHLRVWKKWISDLKKCDIVFYDLPELAEFNTLHCFRDASHRGYAAAIYLVSQFQEYCSSRLVAPKTRIAPGKAYNTSFRAACEFDSRHVNKQGTSGSE